MDPLTTIRFSRDNKVYEVKIAVGDIGLAAEILSFELEATVYDNETGEDHTETVGLELDFNESKGRISIRDEEAYEFSLRGFNVEVDPETGNEIIPGMDGHSEVKDTVFDRVQEVIGNPIERLIQSTPVPDPFIGCMIKGVVSSIVGQAMACNKMVDNNADAGRLRQIWRCLREHAGGMGLRALWRTARCMFRLGF